MEIFEEIFTHHGKTEKTKYKKAIANPAPVWKIELGPFKYHLSIPVISSLNLKAKH
jgi:hypothetical protein